VKVHSIFESISGEAGFFPQGTWCTFIRLQGCNLRCYWCDTPESRRADWPEAKEMTVRQIINECHTKHVLITGGEPLFRDHVELCDLLADLLAFGHEVQVETNGSYYLPEPYRPPVKWVMDRKCPSSGMTGKMIPSDKIESYNSREVILKYVVGNERDVIWMLKDLVRFMDKFPYLIVSPVDADGKKVAWIESMIRALDPVVLDKLIFSVQIHKILEMD